jgi:hypothetical protein
MCYAASGYRVRVNDMPAVDWLARMNESGRHSMAYRVSYAHATTRGRDLTASQPHPYSLSGRSRLLLRWLEQPVVKRNDLTADPLVGEFAFDQGAAGRAEAPTQIRIAGKPVDGIG